MKRFKKLLLALILVPCMFVFCACRSVVDISKSTEVGGYNVYTVSYSDGTKENLTIKDGEDGKNLSIEEIYDVATQNGYTGTILEFIQDYLAANISSEEKVTLATSKALMSTVSIFVEYTVSSNYSIMGMLIESRKDLSLGAGAGVILDIDKTSGDAYIMTNYHVVYNNSTDKSDKLASKIVCFLYGSIIGWNKVDAPDTSTYPTVEYNDYAIECEFVGGSMEYDIAVLKITGSDVIKNSNALAATFADSNNVKIGNTAIAVGNPEGYGLSATKGIISVDSEHITMKAADDSTTVSSRVIRIDAAINGGNSGGGLFNSAGEVVGIVNSKIASESIDNIAFAIPSNVAKRVADNVLRNASAHNKKAYRGMLGMTLEAKDAKAEYNAITGATTTTDVYIKEISSTGVAAKYPAIAVDDKIEKVYINGRLVLDQVTKMYQIIDLTWTLDVGDVVGLKIAGKEMVNIVMEASAFSEVR